MHHALTRLAFAAHRQAVVERKAVQVLILKRDRELAERDQQMQELQRQLGKKKGPQGKTTPPKATAIEEAEADSPHSRYSSACILKQKAGIDREISDHIVVAELEPLKPLKPIPQSLALNKPMSFSTANQCNCLCLCIGWHSMVGTCDITQIETVMRKHGLPNL